MLCDKIIIIVIIVIVIIIIVFIIFIIIIIVYYSYTLYSQASIDSGCDSTRDIPRYNTVYIHM